MTGFGYILWHGGFPYQTLVGDAQECERLGYDSLWIYDHFYPQYPNRDQNWDTLETNTLMTALATKTERVRLGAIVAANSYRNPALHAKIASSIDNISNGRFTLGIGAGWQEEEYVAYGYPYPRPAIRIAQLAEAVQIIRKMFTEDRPSFEGKYYSIKEALNVPKPVQKPHPPIMIGGSSKQLMLRVVARFADIWNTGAIRLNSGSYNIVDRMNALKEHCRAVGRDFNQIKKSLFFETVIASNPSEVEEKMKIEARARGWTLEELKEKIHEVRGTPDQIVDGIKEMAKLGISDLCVYSIPRRGRMKDARLFAEEVIPQFR